MISLIFAALLTTASLIPAPPRPSPPAQVQKSGFILEGKSNEVRIRRNAEGQIITSLLNDKKHPHVCEERIYL